MRPMMPARLWAIGYNVLNWNIGVLRSVRSFAAIFNPCPSVFIRGEKRP